MSDAPITHSLIPPTFQWIVYIEEDDGTYREVARGEPNSGHIEIPEVVEGQTVRLERVALTGPPGFTRTITGTARLPDLSSESPKEPR